MYTAALEINQMYYLIPVGLVLLVVLILMGRTRGGKIFLGLVLLCAGAASIYYGSRLNNDIEAQLNSIFGSGQKDPGNVWIIGGALGAVIGLILLIVGLTQAQAPQASVASEPSAAWRCPNCGTVNDERARFCSSCGYDNRRIPSSPSGIAPAGSGFVPESPKENGSPYRGGLVKPSDEDL